MTTAIENVLNRPTVQSPIPESFLLENGDSVGCLLNVVDKVLAFVVSGKMLGLCSRCLYFGSPVNFA